MEQELDRAAAFVSRLLQNPALNDFSPLQKEEHIIQFLNVNAQQLYGTLSSPAFFPGQSWDQIRQLLIRALVQIVDSELLPHLERLVTGIGFQFVQALGLKMANTAPINQELLQFLQRSLQKHEVRRAFTGSFTAANANLVDRYLAASFARREYVFIELTLVQKLKLDADQLRNLIIAAMLLKSTVHLIVTAPSRDDAAVGTVSMPVVDKAVNMFGQQLEAVPSEVLTFGLRANISCLDDPKLEAVSRFAAIFAARGRIYRPMVQVDRGADTPDKSWFSIARRNYRFYGFDVKMLDELYKIAADNGW